MKRKILIVLFFIQLCASTQLNAQTTLPDSTYTLRYNKLKELYLKMLTSKSSLEALRMTKEFTKKVHYDGNEIDKKMLIEYISHGVDLLMPWIEANIYKTEFGSYNVALQEKERLVQAQAAETEENMEYYLYLQESINIAGQQIFTDLVVEIMTYYPDKFHY